VASAVSVTTLVAEVTDSIRRVCDLVAAVRSYAQLDRASIQHLDVTDGIESTLVMLRNRIGDGVTVVRAYAADVPRIEAYAGELNQVWTNIIDNAVDAMNGAGALRIATRAEADGVVVEIGDSGPGMTPDVAARAFEAFFTTKDAGRGTGLGLDIARRIVVDRHGGSIDVDTRPGAGTVLRVRLPTRPVRR
jgi:signal transduction histidine kinase